MARGDPVGGIGVVGVIEDDGFDDSAEGLAVQGDEIVRPAAGVLGVTALTTAPGDVGAEPAAAGGGWISTPRKALAPI